MAKRAKQAREQDAGCKSREILRGEEQRTPVYLSPELLIQEFVRHDGWQLLVACFMLNQTTAKQVSRVLPEFLERYPTPAKFLLADPDEVRALIRPLGFMNRRFERLTRMSCDYIAWDHRDVLELHGVGKYAADSFRMFIEGTLVLDVEDKELKRYLRWALSQRTLQRAEVGEGCP